MFDKVDFWSEDKIENKKNSFELLINAKVLKQKDVDLIFERIGSVKDLCGLPKKGEHIRVITQKTFTSTDFLIWIAEQETIVKLNLAVYRMNIKNSAILKDMHTKQKFHLNIVLSSFFKTNKKAEVWHDLIADYARNTKNVNLIYCSNHAKIMCIKTKDNYYVIEGSGNMGSNSNIEQYMLDNCEDVYNFHSSWIEELSKKS